jgi:hypothetical protein
MLIRKDNHGLYIRSRWYSKKLGMTSDPAYRPGNFNGHTHVWDTSEAGLAEGDKPQTSHVNGAPFVGIKLANGKNAYWGSYSRTEGDFAEESK